MNRMMTVNLMATIMLFAFADSEIPPSNTTVRAPMINMAGTFMMPVAVEMSTLSYSSGVSRAISFSSL